ncbi:MAG: FAD-binding oxidoreductase [Gammaproteobacteria bacterium]|jgi:FAD/FMN-containing dehydrogenase|nr:MAG: FAD-binding oxidoreductase [Gammaproteobacteria bacterium]
MPQGLDELFSARQLKRDPDSLSQWGCDWTRSFTVAPSAIVFPESVDETVALVRLANESGFALVPSGGRTGLSGGAVAGNGEVVVSFDRMNRILDFSEADRLVRCQAGVVTQTLQEFAEEKGLYYPVDFASAGSSQIGGNISTNAGGIKVIRYGLTRDWVAGLKVVTGTGEVIDCNHGLIKNATGYDLRHLFIGAEGTLGLVVEAEMRLAKAPAPQHVMVLGVPEFPDILKVLNAFQAGLTLSAFEFFSEMALTKVLAHRALQRPLGEPVPFYALLEFDEGDMGAAMSLFERTVAEGWVTDGVLSQSKGQAADLWALREGISESIAPYTPYKNDLSVRISLMPEFIEEVDALVASSYPDFEVCWYGHIGDGNLHLNILKPEALDGEAFYERCHAISPKIFEAVRKRDGSISAEHGVGLLKRDFLGFTRSDVDMALMARLKQVFDPNQVMNPGKLLPDG